MNILEMAFQPYTIFYTIRQSNLFLLSLLLFCCKKSIAIGEKIIALRKIVRWRNEDTSFQQFARRRMVSTGFP